MRTTLDIDASLLRAAVTALGARTKKEAVETSLRETVQRRRSQEIVAALGTFDLTVALRGKGAPPPGDQSGVGCN
jgi:Arc/MetJ family transcription regulator